MAFLVPNSSLPTFYIGEAIKQSELNQMKIVFQDAINHLNDLYKFNESDVTDQVGTNKDNIDTLIAQMITVNSDLSILETNKVDVNSATLANIIAQNYITQTEFDALQNAVSNYIAHIDHPGTVNHSADHILFTPLGTKSIDGGVTEVDAAIDDLDVAVYDLELAVAILQAADYAGITSANIANWNTAYGHATTTHNWAWLYIQSANQKIPQSYLPSSLVIETTLEWRYVGESSDPAGNDGILIDSNDLGEAFDFENFDYKFVYQGSTNTEDGGDQPYILLDESVVGSSNEYAYSFSYSRASGNDNNAVGDDGDANANQIWAGTSLIDVTASGGVTMMSLEFIIKRSEAQAVSGLSYLYIVNGTQQVHSGSGTGDYLSTTVNAIFSGSKENEGANIASVFLHHGMNDGSADFNKIRVYKRSK